MPETTPFTFFGSISDTDPNAVLFTGLPYSFENPFDKENVSDYDYWTTLSGWSKVSEPADDGAKATSIGNSYRNAMKLFWNVDGYATGQCTVTSDGNTGSIPFPVGSADATSGSLDEPKDRECYTGDEDGYRVHDVVLGEGPFGEEDYPYPLNVYCGAPKIIKMYNGVTTEEDNFVGYGIDPFFGTFYMEVVSFPSAWAIELISFLESDFNSPAVAYTEMDGMHFVCNIADGYTGASITLDPANRSIYADEGYAVSTVEMGSFEFYTYPA